ncbi:hypothetical protein [Ferribacterium limneticum]|uniref:hypothetical protein n=1 Tax=Ferribacterium limneticum TaxID=76259 RepID=UPI001CF7EEAD|nr:hypothetical protein [Ferribacterium limneticum]UCV26698.1 hypothetical protein KI617_10295 [Ferribacterium limneticum]UCV30615.1 hypothetical protein KI608_10295 [Ferribacterium limneticum]
MDEVKPKEEVIPIAGVLTGICDLPNGGGKGIGIQLGTGPMFVMEPEYADLLIMQMDLLLSELEVDEGSEPPEPEEPDDGSVPRLH